MFNCLIFSKDRACQLELLLKSINDNFKELNNIIILYKATSQNYQLGYDRLIKTYTNYEWRAEKHFYVDTQEIFRGFQKEFIVNFVDDEIVIRNNSVLPALEALRNEDTHCISLRLAPHINYCYTADSPDPQPPFIKIESLGQTIFKWNWREGWRDASDWHYPSCINSHIYKNEDFKRYISAIHYDLPNPLEGYYNNIRNAFRPCSICFEQSKTINVANNLVQVGTNRYSEKPEFHQLKLNEEFLKGRHLDKSIFYGLHNTLATFPMDYVWEN